MAYEVVTYEWIKANGERQIVVPASKKGFTLKELQQFVGGYIEQVLLPSAGGSYMWVNEDGRRLKLDMNSIATSLYYGAVRYRCIYGDVLVCWTAIAIREKLHEL